MRGDSWLLLDESDVHGWVYPVLGGAALASIIALGFALIRTLEVQKLRKTDALDPTTIKDYVDWAERGHPAVAKNLIQTYARLLDSRRKSNRERSEALKAATWFALPPLQRRWSNWQRFLSRSSPSDSRRGSRA
jgi:hypothetical protein